MKTFSTLKNESTNISQYLIKDYGDTNSWAVLFIEPKSGEVYVKVDKRITGQEKQALEKFKELYGYNCEFSSSPIINK